jgi:hypothetical protein
MALQTIEIQSGNFNFSEQHAAMALQSSLHYRYQKTARHLGRRPDMDWRVSNPSISHLLASLLATAPSPRVHTNMLNGNKHQKDGYFGV